MFSTLLACLGLDLVPSLASTTGRLLSAQWFALAAVVIASGPTARRPPGLASLAPLVLASQGLGALVLAVSIAGKALLERGVPGRSLLAVTLILFGLAGWMDDNTLRLWVVATNQLGLGMDPASLLVDILVELVRLAGWSGALAWGLRGATPPRPPGPQAADPP